MAIKVFIDGIETKYISISPIPDKLDVNQTFSVTLKGKNVFPSTKQGQVYVEIYKDTTLIALGRMASESENLGINPTTTINCIDQTILLDREPISKNYIGAVRGVVERILTDGGSDVFFSGVRFRASDEVLETQIDIQVDSYTSQALTQALEASGQALKYRAKINENILEIYQLGFSSRLAPIPEIDADLWEAGLKRYNLLGLKETKINPQYSVIQVHGANSKNRPRDGRTSANQYRANTAVKGQNNYPVLDIAYKLLQLRITTPTTGCTYPIIRTFAGNGIEGFSGDGGHANAASLDSPAQLTSDGTSFYIADSLNGRIRKVDSSRTITTFAGGAGTFTRFFNIPGYLATTYDSFEIESIAQYDGKIYFTDTSFGVLGEISIATGIYQLIWEFTADSFPAGIVIDQSTGDLYVADQGRSVVWKFTGGAGTPDVVAGILDTPGYIGEGIATEVQFRQPYGICLDSAGSVYVADYADHTVRKISSGTTTLIAGTPGSSGFSGDNDAATSATLNSPSGVVFDSAGNLYIVDSSNNRIRKVDTSGIITTFAGNGVAGFSGDGGLPIDAELNTSFNFGGQAYSKDGHDLYFCDPGNQRVRLISCENTPMPCPPTTGITTLLSSTYTGTFPTLTDTPFAQFSGGDSGVNLQTFEAHFNIDLTNADFIGHDVYLRTSFVLGITATTQRNFSWRVFFGGGGIIHEVNETDPPDDSISGTHDQLINSYIGTITELLFLVQLDCVDGSTVSPSFSLSGQCQIIC